MLCLKHKSTCVCEKHGFDSKEYFDALEEEGEGLLVCILEEGHAGHCSFASGSDVVITFKERPE